MPIIDLKKIQQQTQKKNWSSPYLFLGSETWIADRGYQILKSHIVEPEMMDFNFSVLYSSEISGIDIIEQLESLPIMSPFKFIVVKEAHLLADKDWDLLNQFYDNPNYHKLIEKNILLLLATDGDKRKKQFKKFFDKAHVLECTPPYDNQKRGWIQVLADEENLLLTDSAISFWESHGSFSLSEIALELKKIRLFLDNTGSAKNLEVDTPVLEKLLSQFSEDGPFKLIEVIMTKKWNRSHELIEKLIHHGDNGIGVVQLLARQVRLLLKVKLAQHQGMKSQGLAQFLGVSPYFVNDYIRQAQGWTYHELKMWLVELQKLDGKLKSSSLSPLLWWEQHIIHIQKGFQ